MQESHRFLFDGVGAEGEGEDTKVSSETAPAWWPWKGGELEKPPQPKTYQLPTMAGDGLDYHDKPAAIVQAPALDAYSATIILSGRRQLRWPVELVDSGVFLQGETDAWVPDQYSTIQALYETPRCRTHASERRR